MCGGNFMKIPMILCGGNFMKIYINLIPSLSSEQTISLNMYTSSAVCFGFSDKQKSMLKWRPPLHSCAWKYISLLFPMRLLLNCRWNRTHTNSLHSTLGPCEYTCSSFGTYKM